MTIIIIVSIPVILLISMIITLIMIEGASVPEHQSGKRHDLHEQPRPPSTRSADFLKTVCSHSLFIILWNLTPEMNNNEDEDVYRAKNYGKSLLGN